MYSQDWLADWCSLSLRAQLNLASLPPLALQRYLTRYNLIEQQGTLSYHHAVFPVPALPAELDSPLDGRTLLPRRARTSTARSADTDGPPHTDSPAQPLTPNKAALLRNGDATAGKKRVWVEPKTAEFADLSAFDEPALVQDRLAERARQHWDKKDNIKEG